MKKLAKLILVVIIPLLIAIGISVYAYNRYQTYFFPYYMNNVGYKATQEKMEKYIKFNTDYYDLYFTEEVKDADNNKLFTLSCYRWFEADENEKQMQYVFVAYNMNYGNMFYTMYDKNDKTNEFVGFLPYVRITMENANDDSVKSDFPLVYNSDCQIEDYYFVGYTTSEGPTKKYADGSNINSNTTTKWGRFISNVDYSTDVKMTVDIINGKYAYESLNSGTYKEEDINAGTYNALTKTLTGLQYNAKKYLDVESGKFNGVELNKGYDKNIKAAGYTKYVIGHYMWWEALIAIVLTEIITVTTLLVWTSEAEAEKKKVAKMNKSKK